MRFRSYATALVLVVAVGVLSPVPLAGQEEEQEQQECEFERVTGNAVEAEKLVNQAIKAKSDSVKRQKYQKVLEVLGGDLEKEEPMPVVLLYAGRAHLGLGHYPRGDSLLVRFMDQKPACSKYAQRPRKRAWASLYNQAVRRYQAGNTQGAMAVFDTANMILEDARSLTNAALLHQQAGNAGKAEELYRRAIDAATTQEQRQSAYVSLANLLQRQGKAEASMKVYQKFLEENPDAVAARVNYAASLISAGKKDSARAIYGRLLTKEGLGFELLSNVGLGLIQVGSHEDAVQALQRARQRRPFAKSAMQNLFTALINSQQFESAVSLGDTLIQWYPYEKQHFRNMAKALDRLGQTSRVPKVLGQIQDVPLEFVSISMRQRGDQTYVIQGTVSGQSAAGEVVTIPFELLNGEGEAVASTEKQLQLPQQGQTRSFQIMIRSGEQVSGFRYGKARTGS